MLTLVAAVNTPRLLALGLSRDLEEWGYSVEPVADPRAWARNHSITLLLVVVRSMDDVAFLAELTKDLPSAAVVALLDPMSMERLYLCLGAGARGCISADWSTEDMAMALEAGLRGMTIMPTSVALRLAATETTRTSVRSLTSTQQDWLRDLASGTTVHALATQVGFSEREMYRRLRQVYRAIGCTTRTEALIRASACGMLDLPRAANQA